MVEIDLFVNIKCKQDVSIDENNCLCAKKNLTSIVKFSFFIVTK